MLEETEAYSAPHKPLCMCAYICVCKGMHTQKRRQLTVEVPIVFPKGSCYADIISSRFGEIRGFWFLHLYTDPCSGVLTCTQMDQEKAHHQTSFWGFQLPLECCHQIDFHLFFFMPHQPINTFPPLGSETMQN